MATKQRERPVPRATRREFLLRSLVNGRGRLEAAAALSGLAVGVGAAALIGQSAPSTLMVGAFVALLAAVSAVDLRERRIPNAYVYPAAIAAIAVAGLEGRDAALAAIGGLALSTLLMGAAYVVGRGRLGMGDVKLCGFAGAVLGPGAVVAFLLVGTAAGAIGAAVLILRGKGRTATLAYGPYLAFGAAYVAIVQGPLIG